MTDSKKKSRKKRKKDVSLAREIKEVSKDLFYLSEIDTEVFPFVGEECVLVNKENLLFQIQATSDLKIQEISFEEFFENLIKIEEWFEKEEIENAERFTKLKKLLEENLEDLKVFKVGKVDMDIFVVGLNKEKFLMGVQTKAIET